MKNFKELKELMKRIQKISKIEVKSPNKFYEHLESSYYIAEETTKKILEKHPSMPLDIESITTAAGIHDIGKLIDPEFIYHEIRGAEFTRVYGEFYKLFENERQKRIICYTILSHTIAYETSLLYPIPLYHITQEDLKPTTWEELILTYSDLINFSGKRISAKERINEVLSRYHPDSMMYKIISTAKPRLIRIEQDVEELMSSKNEVLETKYGFL